MTYWLKNIRYYALCIQEDICALPTSPIKNESDFAKLALITLQQHGTIAKELKDMFDRHRATSELEDLMNQSKNPNFEVDHYKVNPQNVLSKLSAAGLIEHVNIYPGHEKIALTELGKEVAALIPDRKDDVPLDHIIKYALADRERTPNPDLLTPMTITAGPTGTTVNWGDRVKYDDQLARQEENILKGRPR